MYERYIERLIEISKKKYRLVEEIYNLTKSQSEFIKEDGIEGLGKIVEAKQIKIEEINGLDSEFEVYFTRLKQTMRVNSLEEIICTKDVSKKVLELKDTITNIMSMVKEISSMENHNNTCAKELLNNIGSEIKKINLGKKMNNLYNKGAYSSDGYYIDRKK